LKIADCTHGGWPIDAIHAAAVKTEASEVMLDLSDVIAAQVGCDQDQIAVAEFPRGFDEGGPSVRVTDSRGF
jgi:hypothetical protein